jgi:hypothetical protein
LQYTRAVAGTAADVNDFLRVFQGDALAKSMKAAFFPLKFQILGRTPICHVSSPLLLQNILQNGGRFIDYSRLRYAEKEQKRS